MPTLVLQVKVKPQSRQSALAEQADGSWIAQLKAPPIEGRANDELIALVARHFRVRRSQVTIAGGAASRTKRLRIESPD